MNSIWLNIFIIASLIFHLSNASAPSLDHATVRLYRRTNPSDDEFEVYRKADEIKRQLDDLLKSVLNLRTYHSQPNDPQPNIAAVASKPPVHPIDRMLEDSDGDSTELPQSRKRKRIISKSRSVVPYKTTGLNQPDESNNDGDTSTSTQNI
jgi:hypothetical protein